MDLGVDTKNVTNEAKEEEYVENPIENDQFRFADGVTNALASDRVGFLIDGLHAVQCRRPCHAVKQGVKVHCFVVANEEQRSDVRPIGKLVEAEEEVSGYYQAKDAHLQDNAHNGPDSSNSVKVLGLN